MASSAVYRYFPSRDELLTELLVIIYGELADLLEAADAACERADLSGRWRTLGSTLRGWAVSAPHEYALLYGSPVPGYAAPEATVAPSARVTGVLIGLAVDLDVDRAADDRRSPTSARRPASICPTRRSCGRSRPGAVCSERSAWSCSVTCTER